MDLSLSFLFCSIDLYFCLCASTILSWWLWLCRRVWSQAGWFLQFHSSFSKLLWLFKVFFRHKERKFYFDTLSYIRFGIWYNHNRITIRKKNQAKFLIWTWRCLSWAHIWENQGHDNISTFIEHFLLQGSSWPRDRTHISYIGRQFLYPWATRESPESPKASYLHMCVCSVTQSCSTLCNPME